MEINAIYEGDNLEIMSKFPSKSIDLIYADPPFFTNQNYEVIWHDKAEIRSFEDRWEGGIEHYISWMEPRLRECHRLLKDTGSIYLHCDFHASAHLRILMDKIFGEGNFRNEIVWKRTTAHNDPKQFGHNSDRILFFTKSTDYVFNVQYTEYETSYLDSVYNNEDENGRYMSDNLTGAGINKNDKEWKGYNPSERGRHWAIPRAPIEELAGDEGSNLSTIDKLNLLFENGLVYFTSNGTPRYKRYLSGQKGLPLQEIWTDISAISSQSAERLGYPTQKPLALLERIVKASSNEGDLVFDPFCGCGTTIIASQKLERKWIGIDISPTACNLMQKRLRKEFTMNAQIIRGAVDIKYVKKLPPFEFQNWVVTNKFFGTVSKTKSGDFGIDGLTPQVTGGYPIQVKQSDDIGRNVIDNFETAIRRMNKKKGYVVAFSFGRGAVEEAARVKNQEGIEIILRTVQDLLDGKIE